MATEQIMNKVIVKALAEAMRAAIQAMAEAAAEWLQGTAEPKIDGPFMKQPTFNWDAEDIYSKLKTFRLKVNNILSIYNTLETEKLAMVKIGWGGRDSNS